MAKNNRKGAAMSPWDNIQMSWHTPPEQVRLKTDGQVNISWPFGDDLAEVMSSLNDEYFRVFLKKAWALCTEEARRRPQSVRDAFLTEQRRRLDGYKLARRDKARSSR